MRAKIAAIARPAKYRPQFARPMMSRLLATRHAVLLTLQTAIANRCSRRSNSISTARSGN
jgi:hypothetical protein